MLTNTLADMRRFGEEMTASSPIDLFASNKVDLEIPDINSAAYFKYVASGHTNRVAPNIDPHGTLSKEEKQERDEKLRSMRSMVTITETSENLYDTLDNYFTQRIEELRQDLKVAEEKFADIEKREIEVREDLETVEEAKAEIDRIDTFLSENPEVRLMAGDELKARQMEEQRRVVEHLKENGIILEPGTTLEGGIDQLREKLEELGISKNQIQELIQKYNDEIADTEKQQKLFQEFEGLKEYINETPPEEITRERLEEIGLSQENIETLAKAIPGIKLAEKKGWTDHAYDEFNRLIDYLSGASQEELITLEGMRANGLDTVIDVYKKQSTEPNEFDDGQGINTSISLKTDYLWAAKPQNMSVIGQPQMSTRPDLEPQMSIWDKEATQNPMPTPAPSGPA